MNVSEIKNTIKNTDLEFERTHFFEGIHDRYKDNHDVLVNGKCRICAEDIGRRNKWKILLPEQSSEECIKYTKVAENLALTEAIRVATEKGLVNSSVYEGDKEEEHAEVER